MDGLGMVLAGERWPSNSDSDAVSQRFGDALSESILKRGYKLSESTENQQ